MFEINAARRDDPVSEAEFRENQNSRFRTERLPLVLGVLILSALAGGGTAWLVLQIISLLST